MTLSVLFSAITSIFSCLQISFYIPFKKNAWPVFFVLTWASTFALVYLYNTKYYLPACIAYVVILSALGLLVFKTSVRCGIYNVVIQLCINLICIVFAVWVLQKHNLSEISKSVLSLLLCVSFEGAWTLAMKYFRKTRWVIMPMPDHYYRGVMIFVILDYALIVASKYFSEYSLLNVIPVSIFVIVIILYSIWLPQLIIREQQISNSLEYQKRVMQNYTSLYMKHEQEMRRISHDIKHVLSTIEGLLKDNNREKIEEVLDETRAAIKDKYNVGYCDNVLINAILTDYAEKFRTLKMVFEVTARLPDTINVTDLDMTILLHNILSNAYEYCSNMEEKDGKKVEMKFYTVRNYLCLTCRNPLEGEVCREGNFFKSNKDEVGAYHGIGLESIQNTVDKYSGEFSISTDNGTFDISLMLLNN